MKTASERNEQCRGSSFSFSFSSKRKRHYCSYTTVFSRLIFPPAQLYISLDAGHAQSLGKVRRVNLWLNNIIWPCIQSYVSHRVRYSLQTDLQHTTYHLQHVAGSWFYSSPEGIMSVNNQLLRTHFASWQSIKTFRFLNWKNMLYFFFIWM